MNPKPDSSLVAIEAELQAEAVAIERLRKSIQAKGATPSPAEVAEFAKRQKAFLDRKIDFEKQRKAVVGLPRPQDSTSRPAPAQSPVVPVPPAPRPEAPSRPEPAKPPVPITHIPDAVQPVEIKPQEPVKPTAPITPKPSRVEGPHIISKKMLPKPVRWTQVVYLALIILAAVATIVWLIVNSGQ